MSRWFRVDDGLVDDPKVQQLSDRLFRHLINIWCVTSQNSGQIPPVTQLAFKLRISEKKTEMTLAELKAFGLVDQGETGLRPHNWDQRQYKSDGSTERVKRFRKRFRNVSSAVSETGPDTDTDTDTERIEAKASIARKRATRLSSDWWPTLDNINYAVGKGLDQQRISTEAEKFRNYWMAKSGHGATKLDWDATWQNWILNACERGGPRNEQTGESLSDRAFRLAERARSAERARGADRPAKPVGSD